MKFPILYGLDSKNNIREWIISVEKKSNNLSIIIVKHGLQNGKKVETIREVTKGVNIGKANEKNVHEKALFDAEKKWYDQKEKKNYNEQINMIKQESILLPMLADKFNDKKDLHIEYPAYVQPKYDGVRAITYTNNDELKILSRTGKEYFNLHHIHKDLHKIMTDEYGLDGEIYTPDLSFQVLAGLVKLKDGDTKRLNEIEKMKFYVFDIIPNEKDITFDDRYKKLKQLEKIIKKKRIRNIIISRTEIVNNKEEVIEKHNEYVSEGYEGIMIRNKKGVYKPSKRSKDLKKYKSFIDSEYPIVGFKEGSGTDKGTVIWIVRTPEGIDFSVRPKGTHEYREELLKDANNQIGKLLTVKYQELSDTLVPRFPVGVVIRDY